MTSSLRTALLAALVFLPALPAAAAEAAAGQETTPARPSARPATSAPARQAPSANLSAQAVYQVLLGEIALQRDNAALAASAYADLGARSGDPAVLERAVEVSLLARRPDAAYELAHLWLKADPNSRNARQTLAAVLIMLNRVDELGPQLAALLADDREHLAGNLLRINRMLGRMPDKAAVYAMLERVLSPYAGVAEAHYALATAAFHAGDGMSALMEIRKAAALRPDWETAVLFEAELVAKGSPQDAVSLLEAFLARQPQAREVRLALARTLISLQRHAEARQQFAALLAADPENTDLIYPAAVLALQQNDVGAAEPLLLRLYERGSVGERSAAAYYLGQIAEERGDASSALAYYAKVAPSEQFVAAQVRSAGLLQKSSGIYRARAQLAEAAKVYPDGRIRFLVAEAQLLFDAGDRDAAASLFTEIAAAKSDDEPDLLYDIALLAEKFDRMDVVESRLRRVIALRPDNAHAYNALGYSLVERNQRLDEARELLAKALAIAPTDPFIMDSMGWLLYRSGDLAGARTLLQKAYAQRADPEIAAHLGEVLWMLERRAEAQALWSEAAERFPGSAVLDAVRRRLAP